MNESQGSGWISFCGMMILLLGFLNVVYGIAAIGDAAALDHEAQHLISSNLTLWGWVHLLVGILQVIAAFSIWQGQPFGVLLGLLVASFGIVGAMLALPAFPVWSFAVLLLSVLVAYGLAVHGGERAIG